jgi:hypothetical protein
MLFRISAFKGWFYIRHGLLVFASSTFFSCVLLSAILSEWFSPNPLYSGSPPLHRFYAEGNILLLIFSVFISNIVLSAFIFVTLPGFIFFPLSSVALVYRAYVWGCLLAYLPTRLLLIALPTLVLEGLGYCFAATAGTMVGLSWIKPKWIYGGEPLRRAEAFRKAIREFLAPYVFVAIFLFFAAVVEATTLMIV